MITLDQLRLKSPRQFEEFVASKLPHMGYKDIKLTTAIADSGYDISAYKGNMKVLFECKKYSANNKVGSRDVRIFADACRRMKADKGIFVTTGFFTSTVAEEQRSRTLRIDFWDGKELLRQLKNLEKVDAFCIKCNKKILGYYNRFDWKNEVARESNSQDMKKLIYAMKEDLVPANPRQCEECKYSFACSSCRLIFDSRHENAPLYHDKLYCYECYIKRKKRNRLIWLISVPIITICILIVIYFMIKSYNEDPNIVIIIAISIVMFIGIICECGRKD